MAAPTAQKAITQRRMRLAFSDGMKDIANRLMKNGWKAMCA